MQLMSYLLLPTVQACAQLHPCKGGATRGDGILQWSAATCWMLLYFMPAGLRVFSQICSKINRA